MVQVGARLGDGYRGGRVGGISWCSSCDRLLRLLHPWRDGDAGDGPGEGGPVLLLQDHGGDPGSCGAAFGRAAGGREGERGAAAAAAAVVVGGGAGLHQVEAAVRGVPTDLDNNYKC